MPTRKPGEMSPQTEQVLRRAGADGMLRSVPHSIARALRSRNLGEIVAKHERDFTFPNGKRLQSRTFPTVTFRLNDRGRAESARLLLAAGDPEGAANVQVASVPVGNK